MYYEPLWIDPQQVLRLAGNPTPAEFGFLTDSSVAYIAPVQLMIARAKLNALAFEVSKSAQGMVSQYLGCDFAGDVARVATLMENTERGAEKLPVELAKPLDEGVFIQVGMGSNRELAQVDEPAGENATALILAKPLKHGHKALAPVLMADSLNARTSLPEPSAILRQATLEVAANILANVIVRRENLSDTLETRTETPILSKLPFS